MKKIMGGLVVLASIAGILTLLSDVFDLGAAKSVNVVAMPPIQLDLEQIDEIISIKDKQDSIQKVAKIKQASVVTAIQKKSTVVLRNMDSVMIARAKVNIAVMFNNVLGKNFAKLTISPFGNKPVSLPVYNSGQYIEFNSNTGKHVATVLSVDFNKKNIEVDVSRTGRP